MSKKVDCVVVTYNRLSLLKECLEALLNQEYLLNKIYVINNNSTDGTKEYLKHFSEKNSVIKPVNLRKNIGGAGGFNIGLKYFMKKSNFHKKFYNSIKLNQITKENLLVRVPQKYNNNNN